MKKTLIVALLSASLMACASPRTLSDGNTYVPYGLVNEKEDKNSKVQYEVSGGNIFWSVVFSATIVAPVYFIGWRLYQPVGLKRAGQEPGQR